MGAFLAKFSTPPSGKTMDWTQKSIRPKIMAWATCIIMQNLMEIARRTLAWEDEMWCFLLYFYFFENNAVGRRPLWCVVDLLPQDIASTFVGRFRCRLHHFFAEEKRYRADLDSVLRVFLRKRSAFLTIEQFFKIVDRGRYDWCPNSRKKFENLKKMSAKFLCTTSTI